MKAAVQARTKEMQGMDDFGVLDRLIYDRVGPANVESIARILGMVHLYRASGVHLLAFFTFLNAGVLLLGKHLGLAIGKSKLFSLILCAFTIFWIWQLQDFRVTLIRPILTFLIRLFFKERGAIARISVPLVLTFISETLLSPSTSFTDGALHYYGSVAGGLFAYHLESDASFFRKHLALAVGSWLPVALVSLIRDHEVSYFTPIYSLVSLPIISFFLYPLTLIDLWFHPVISPSIIFLWDIFLRFLFLPAQAGITFAPISAPAFYAAFPLALAVGIFGKKLPKPYLSFAVIVVALGTFGRNFAEAALPSREIIQLDVHQGDGSILRAGSTRTEMVDVGSLKTDAPSTWLGKLARFDVTRVDGVMLSHLDEDHCGALKELLLLMPVSCVETHGELWASEKGQRLQAWIHQNAPQVQFKTGGCLRLPKIAWFKSTRAGSAGNELMGGIVFPLTEHEAYFAIGDGDEAQELAYEKHFQAEINAYPLRIWKVSHHGSRFSSNFGFLKRLAPIEFWISVGKHNPYHHPNPLTLAKLSFLPGKVYRTDVVGDVIRSFRE